MLSAAALLSPRIESGRADDPPAEVVPGELVVTFTPTSTEAAQDRAVSKTGGEIEQRIESLDAAVITVDPDRTDMATKRLLRERSVQAVEPNFVVRAARLPNDRDFADQWGLRNLGHFDGKPGADVGAPAAWDVTIGGSVPVAVVDTGVSFKHPDLSGNAWAEPG